MTINSQNYITIGDLAEEWRGKVNKIGFQFHTPFVKGNPLVLLPFGDVQDKEFLYSQLEAIFFRNHNCSRAYIGYFC